LLNCSSGCKLHQKTFVLDGCGFLHYQSLFCSRLEFTSNPVGVADKNIVYDPTLLLCLTTIAGFRWRHFSNRKVPLVTSPVPACLHPTDRSQLDFGFGIIQQHFGIIHNGNVIEILRYQAQRLVIG
jgi:hypothetical protein